MKKALGQELDEGDFQAISEQIWPGLESLKELLPEEPDALDAPEGWVVGDVAFPVGQGDLCCRVSIPLHWPPSAR